MRNISHVKKILKYETVRFLPVQPVKSGRNAGIKKTKTQMKNYLCKPV